MKKKIGTPHRRRLRSHAAMLIRVQAIYESHYRPMATATLQWQRDRNINEQVE